jgi:type I restriction enzyme S subunit
MQVKKGYQRTEVGVIPKEWYVVNLGELTVKVGSGITPTGGERVYKKEGRPFLRSQNVGWGHLLMDDIAFIDDNTHETFHATEIMENDVFLNITGASIGRSAVAGNRVVGGNVNQHVCIIRTVKEKLHPHFLNFFLLSKVGQKQIDSFQAGGNRQGLNFGQIRSFKISLPPTKVEQTAIATALSDTDTLISRLEKLIAKKRNIKQGAMQQLLTSKKRLPGFSGEWEVKKLGEVCGKITTGKLDANAMVENGKYRFYTCAKEYYWIDCYAFNTEALLVSGNGANVGYIYHYKGKFNAYQRTYVLSDFSEDILYIKLFMDRKLQNRIKTEVNAGNTPYIKMGTLTKMEIQIPPTKSEQTAIAQTLSDMDAEIEQLELKLDKYRMIKQGMMQELLTGRIRLVNIEASKKPTAIVKVLPKKADSQKKTHNWEFNEAVVISVFTKTFGSQDYPLGRKRYTKFSYLLHRYAERKVEGYLKKAAGPYNPATRYKGPEKIAQTRGYIKAHSNGKYNGFIAGDNIEDAVGYFNKWYGPETLQWLEQFRQKKNDQLELLTTIDMAVQDLRKSKQNVSIASVKALIQNHDEWRAKLKQAIFSDNNIGAAINLSEDLFGY